MNPSGKNSGSLVGAAGGKIARLSVDGEEACFWQERCCMKAEYLLDLMREEACEAASEARN